MRASISIECFGTSCGSKPASTNVITMDGIIETIKSDGLSVEDYISYDSENDP